jgi:hypothetical protein
MEAVLAIRIVSSRSSWLHLLGWCYADPISVRTKAALQAAKARGRKLGGDRGVVPTAKARALARKVVESRADARAAEVAPTIEELQAAGITSLRRVAAALNEQGIPTARGSGLANGRRPRSRAFSAEWLDRSRSDTREAPRRRGRHQPAPRGIGLVAIHCWRASIASASCAGLRTAVASAFTGWSCGGCMQGLNLTNPNNRCDRRRSAR